MLNHESSNIRNYISTFNIPASLQSDQEVKNKGNVATKIAAEITVKAGNAELNSAWAAILNDVNSLLSIALLAVDSIVSH